MKKVKLKIPRGRKSELAVPCQVVINPFCGLSVIFCGFISHLIGRETINIPEIFFGVHGFTGKTVTMNLTKLPWVLESSETWHEYIKLYFETKLAILRSLYDFSPIFQQDVLTGRTDGSQVPSDEEH